MAAVVVRGLSRCVRAVMVTCGPARPGSVWSGSHGSLWYGVVRRGWFRLGSQVELRHVYLRRVSAVRVKCGNAGRGLAVGASLVQARSGMAVKFGPVWVRLGKSWHSKKDSSTVEQCAVNASVAGSSPAPSD